MRLKKSGKVGEEWEEKSKGGGGRGEEGRHGGGGGGEECLSIVDEEGKSLDLSAGCVSSLQLILCLRRKSASHSS